MTSSTAPLVAAVGAAALVVGSPLFGWLPLIRLPAVLVPVLAVTLLSARPWRWQAVDLDAIAAWTPSRTTIMAATIATAAVLGWIVLTRFRSGDINAVDFTVYFDRPIYQTAHGRLMLVETADLQDFSHRSQFAVHAYYNLLLLAPLYRLAATPYWLLSLSVVAVVLGAFHTFRIVRNLSGIGILAAAAALAFVLNANTARTLLYGFHPEVLYAWFVPAAIDAAIHRRRGWFAVAVIAAATVKEDAIFPLFGLSVTLALAVGVPPNDRWLYCAAPPAIAAVDLAGYYAWVLPLFEVSSNPVYAGFWSNYGSTPARALFGMLSRPLDVARSVATSGLLRVLLPHALLPLAGWRWVLGILPLVALYGASANVQIRDFGVYYSIVIVPFLVLSSAFGALAVARAVLGREAPARIAAAATVALAALLVYGDRAGYSLRPWRPEVAAAHRVVERLASERSILVQSALYPHTGYDSRVVMLTRETLRDAQYRGAATLLAPALNAYPFTKGELDALAAGGRSTAADGGIVIVRHP
jgi:uncharacterized membrane protein